MGASHKKPARDPHFFTQRVAGHWTGLHGSDHSTELPEFKQCLGTALRYRV